MHIQGSRTGWKSPGETTRRAVKTLNAQPKTRRRLGPSYLAQCAGVLVSLALGLVIPNPAPAVTLFSSPLPPVGFSDILTNPLDHESWDGMMVTYKFDASFSAMFPN